MARTLKLTLVYEGTNFAGWQIQPEARTIQGAIEQALAKITGEEIRIAGSGRTDAGVHALGQVASLTTDSRLPTETLQRALNAELPEDVAVVEVADAPPGFHARRDAVAKRYRYAMDDGPVRDVMGRRFAWHVRYRLDEAAMHRAGQVLIGRHDFSSFESEGAPRATSVRTITELSVTRGSGRAADVVTLEVEADGFLYNMVRAIVGTLVEVGRGARDESWPADVLAARDRAAGGPTAPPHGLCLLKVRYAGFGAQPHSGVAAGRPTDQG